MAIDLGYSDRAWAMEVSGYRGVEVDGRDKVFLLSRSFREGYGNRLAVEVFRLERERVAGRRGVV